MFKKQSYDEKTLEDVIVQLYKESLSSKSSRIKEIEVSPYMQPVAPTPYSLLPTSKDLSTTLKINHKRKRRPHSAKLSVRSQPIEIPTQIDLSGDKSLELSNKDKTDEVEVTTIATRPSSAYVSSNRKTSKQSAKSSYRQTATKIICRAFINGTFNNFVKIVEPNIKQLLERATIKLKLNMAARRVFLEDGSEAFRNEDISKDAAVFISMGESYKDPFKKENQKKKLLNCKRLNRLLGKETYKILVFVNGEGRESHEVLVDEKDDKNKFLDKCTSKLGLNGSARNWFDWKGNAIKLHSVESIDATATSGSAVYGPLWITKGEGFDVQGPIEFHSNVISCLRSKINKLKVIQKRRQEKMIEMEYFDSSEDTKDEENDENLIKTKNEIENLRKSLSKYKKRVKTLMQISMNREDNKFAHITEIDINDMKLGISGLQVTIYDNGSDSCYRKININLRNILKTGSKKSGINQSSENLHWFRFLKELSSWHKPKVGTARSLLIRRLFDKNGTELFNIHQIENDQKIWVSYGENFKPFSTKMLKVSLHLVTEVKEESEEKMKINQLFTDLTSSKDWIVREGIPDDMKDSLQKTIEEKKVSMDDCFIQNKKFSKLLVFPSLDIDEKSFTSLPTGYLDIDTTAAERMKNGFMDAANAEIAKAKIKDQSSIWVFDKKGQIYLRHFPKLFLSVDKTCFIRVTFANGFEMKGYVLKLEKRNENINTYQRWSYTPNGNIVFDGSNDDYQLLTFVTRDFEGKIEEFDENNGEFLPKLNAPNNDFVIVSNQLESRYAEIQRWAVKQEYPSYTNQWKFTQVPNKTWKKLRLSWPVLSNGNWNEDYDWPLTGKLIAQAPTTRSYKKEIKEVDECVRIKAFKNGEVEKNKGVYVVAPNLNNIDVKKQKKFDNKMQQKRKQNEILELNLFFEKVTSLLNLRFSARRLFDSQGTELFNLRGLKRDEVVFVSCGESWIDPKINKSEQQRRLIINKLNNSVRLIEIFCKLRNPQDFVIELEKGFVYGSRLIINKSKKKASVCEETEELKNEIENEKNEKDEAKSTKDEAMDVKSETWHEKTHKKIKNKLKYAWQAEEEIEEEQQHEDKTEVLQSTNLKKKKRFSNQQFAFDDGFIYPKENPDLVFEASGVELDKISNFVEIILSKRSFSNPAQQWEITEDFIHLKCNKNWVLGVNLPVFDQSINGFPKLEGCAVTLQTLKPVGRANQTFSWISDRIFAFQSSVEHKELTAAIQMSICTYAVFGSKPIYQEGFSMNQGKNRIKVCGSCAKVLRSEITSKSSISSFVCGSRKTNKCGVVKHGTGLSCLDNRFDLSTFEAQPTLTYWNHQLNILREETSLKAINQGLNSTNSTTCKVLARKNGANLSSKPELIIGSSITGILDQCTYRLNLLTAAKRLYTSNGMQILHMEQLIQWALDNYKEKELVDKDEGHIRTSTNHHAKNPSSINEKLIMLKQPIEVWVSSGENFIIQSNKSTNQEIEKEILLNTTGKQLRMKQTEFKSTKQDQDNFENEKTENKRNWKYNGINLKRKLYAQSKRKRVSVHLNGSSQHVYVWGESIKEILSNATFKLNLWRPARRLYDKDGVQVSTFDLIDRDAELTVTTGEALHGRPKQSDVGMKAEWARARRRLGKNVAEDVLTSPFLKYEN